jgi:hypothetical protein
MEVSERGRDDPENKRVKRGTRMRTAHHEWSDCHASGEEERLAATHGRAMVAAAAAEKQNEMKGKRGVERGWALD